MLGDEVSLTPIGEAVQKLLSSTTSKWGEIHRIVGARGGALSLADHRPQDAAVLRLLLLQDTFVRLVIQGLETRPERSANFRELAAICDQLDHARAPIFFLQPEALARFMNHRGKIAWAQTRGEHYRSRTFYQYKSVLKHAGILNPEERLGGDSTKTYNPDLDIWSLR